MACLGLGSCRLPHSHSQRTARFWRPPPIYEPVAVPHEECVEYSSHTRCKTRTVYEDELVGYDVLYEYQGQQYSQRMAHNPGKRIPIHATQPSGTYRNTDRANANNAPHRGTKSYGSTPPGAAPIESIEYRANDNDLPIIDMRIGTHPPHRPRVVARISVVRLQFTWRYWSHPLHPGVPRIFHCPSRHLPTRTPLPAVAELLSTVYRQAPAARAWPYAFCEPPRATQVA